MKTIIAAAVLAAFGSTVSAADLGYGISFTGEATAEYNLDAEVMSVVVVPTVGYYASAIDAQFEVSSTLSIYDDELVDATFETLPTLDFRVEKGVFTDAVVYGEVSYDLEADVRSDAVVGLTFTF